MRALRIKESSKKTKQKYCYRTRLEDVMFIYTHKIKHSGSPNRVSICYYAANFKNSSSSNSLKDFKKGSTKMQGIW